jgi:hypothetical protein
MRVRAPRCRPEGRVVRGRAATIDQGLLRHQTIGAVRGARAPPLSAQLSRGRHYVAARVIETSFGLKFAQ